MNKNKCIDCGKTIWQDSIRCKKCYFISQSITRKGKNNPCWRGGVSYIKCIDCGKIIRTTKGKEKRCRKCYYKIIKAENNPNWKGGKRRIRFYGYDESVYMKWRMQILQRDNFTCQICKSRNNLNVHHIIPNRINSNRILDITNAITLCEKCHEKTYFKEIKFACKLLKIVEAKCRNS